MYPDLVLPTLKQFLGDINQDEEYILFILYDNQRKIQPQKLDKAELYSEYIKRPDLNRIVNAYEFSTELEWHIATNEKVEVYKNYIKLLDNLHKKMYINLCDYKITINKKLINYFEDLPFYRKLEFWGGLFSILNIGIGILKLG